MDFSKSYLTKRITIGILFFFCQNISAQSFTLKGTLKDQDNGYIILRYFRDEIKKRQSDTVAITHGKFQFTGTVTGVDFALIESNANYGTELFIEPGVINVTFYGRQNNKVVISGSKVQKEYDALRKNTNNENLELHRLSAFYKTIDSLLKNSLIDSKTAEERRKEIDKISGPIYTSKSNKELLYIKKHSNSYVSLNLLYYFIGRIPKDSIDILYASLSDNIKGSALDYSFLAYYSKYRKAIADEYPFDKLKMNEKAPPFTIYNTLTKDSIMLNDFNGEVLILEFWGLTCFPCLKANPILEDIRKQYGKDKLKIVAINNNQGRELPELFSYINKNKLSEWIHVFSSDEVMQKNNLIYKGDFNNYAGLEVPRTILIDKNGRVVYKNYGYSSDEMQNLKLLIDKVVSDNIK